MVPLTAPVTQALCVRELTSAADLQSPEPGVDLLAIPLQNDPDYLSGFAVSPRLVERALRLRYEVFNEELGEGLSTSVLTGLDKDDFDDQMAHLVLIERATNAVVGTYRLQSVEHGLAHRGIYCAREYDLTPLEGYFKELVECGRACVVDGHRSYQSVIHLWRGLAVFMDMFRMRYLFGCCSLTTVDPLDGWRALKTLRDMKAMHRSLYAAPLPAASCGDPALEHDPAIGPGIRIPKLFSAYLKLGTKVVSQPAIDREFGTVDFLVMLDSAEVNFSSLLAQLT